MLNMRGWWNALRGKNWAWVPLFSLSVLVGVVVFLLVTKRLPAIVPGEILGFNGNMVGVAIVAGFLGSFVRVLNRAIGDDYADLHLITMVFVGLMRPLAGSMLGLFVMFAFASGFIGMPIGKPEEAIFTGINKGQAFVFAVAFVAGLVDEFVINITNRFIGHFAPDRNEQNAGGRPTNAQSGEAGTGQR